MESGTEYIGLFNGICQNDSDRAAFYFKTKPEQTDKFKILALSCDRPGRLLMGQKNPWATIAKKAKNADCILHLGDQVYAKGEEMEDAMAVFEKSLVTLTPTRRR